jgi:hypothetical protein
MRYGHGVQPYQGLWLSIEHRDAEVQFGLVLQDISLNREPEPAGEGEGRTANQNQ